MGDVKVAMVIDRTRRHQIDLHLTQMEGSMSKAVHIVVAVALSLIVLKSTCQAQQKDFEFEGDVIEVDPTTGNSPSVESLSFKVGISEARINQYLNESRFRVRSGLEQAFKDYRVWFRTFNQREEIAVVKLIKGIIGSVFDMVAIIVPASG